MELITYRVLYCDGWTLSLVAQHLCRLRPGNKDSFAKPSSVPGHSAGAVEFYVSDLERGDGRGGGTTSS